MRRHVTERIKTGVWKASAVSSRFYTSLIRTCLLNLIAQIAIGTPIAAQVAQPTHQRPAITDIEEKCPARRTSNVIVWGAEPGCQGNCSRRSHPFFDEPISRPPLGTPITGYYPGETRWLERQRAMRKLIEHSIMTLDGVFENPGAWGYMDYKEDEWYRDGSGEVMACEAMLFGRGSYEACARSFGQRTDTWAARVTAMKKYVFTSTLEKADWNNTTIVRGNAAAEVAGLKQQDGGDLLIYGHTSLAEALFTERLIDVFHIALYPVILGRGRRFFREGQSAKLRLLAAKTYSKGGVRLTYEPQY